MLENINVNEVLTIVQQITIDVKMDSEYMQLFFRKSNSGQTVCWRNFTNELQS